jgi:L-iditol 2-dehydrogenase
MLGIMPGQSVLITGAGPIGVICGQWAAASGASKVFFTDLDPRKIALAVEYGFHGYDGEMVDAAIEGTGHSAPLGQILGATNPRGTVVLMGNPAGDISLSQKDYWHILRKELSIKGTWNSRYNRFRDEWRITAEAIAGGRIKVDGLITHRYALGDCVEAFGTLKARDQFVNKVMFVVG